MDNNDLIKELLDLEAWATGTAQLAARLRKKLEPVSTGASKKPTLSPEQATRMLARKYKNLKVAQ